MAAPIKKAIDKNTLRRLMKEQKSKIHSGSTTSRLDSPLARYNSVGQLSCKICNLPVKSEKLWPAHINGRTHKEKIQSLKTCTSLSASGSKPEAQGTILGGKSSVPKESRKKSGTVPEGFDGGVGSSKQSINDRVPSSISAYADSSDEESEPQVSNKISGKKETSEQKKPPTDAKTLQEKLPEGFFDSKQEEAKVMKKDYKDPQVEEWEKFQKEIAGVQTESEQLMEEDDEEAKTRRQLLEIEEQLEAWQRVQELEKKQDVIKTKMVASMGKKAGDEGAAAEDEEAAPKGEGDEDALVADLFDWKAKGVS